MFVHLRLHTEFSIVDGTNRIAEVVARAAGDGQPAMAITDLSNLFGAIKFYKAARGKGIKPIIGCELVVTGFSADANHTARLLVLAQNHQGYLNLCELISRVWTDSPSRSHALCKAAWLRELGDGLIVLSGAQAGPVGQALVQGDEARAADAALLLAGWFPHRFYLEVQRAGRADDEAHVAATVQLAARLRLPVVATHPMQFLDADDYEAHEARVCIAEGEILANPRRVRRFTREQHFQTAAQMQARFADLPSALANAVEIARRCSLSLQLGKPQLPDFPTPGGMPIGEYFRQASREGLERRLAQRYPDGARRQAERARYEQRLDFEIQTIEKMGFAGYFLIVADFIGWARAHGCPVGPGRGSGAGSLVAWALGITDLDPLEYQLLFERFLNPERVSMPDFDIDFCQANRDRVIEYVKSRYGTAAVSQIATFGTMAARAAIRDVGRVMGLSYGLCDGVAKLVPNKPGADISLQPPPPDKAADDKTLYALEEPELARRVAAEEDVRSLVEMAQKLEGITRNVGMHAGGVLIAPGKLTDFCPLYQQPGSTAAVSQYDKDDVEAAGLVKFDFLGLATLTILEHGRRLLIERGAVPETFSFDDVPLDDARVYRLFADGQTEAVFQFESSGMQRMLRDAQPTRLEDLIALNAMFRPGPMENIPSFCARKHGRETVTYPHPLLEPILAETYGIFVYQEQVMQAAQVLGGYSLGGADLLRRAMGKKKPEEMAQQRLIFREGAAKKGITGQQADDIFDLMEKFAGYGFNKSHAAAYSLLAYHTAWLKVHHPAVFFCANMTVEIDNTDKLKVLADDARRMGLSFEPPDVNRGGWAFEPVSDRVIRYGLGAVKGTGQSAIEAIVAARAGRGGGARGEASGAFTSLFEFCARVDRTRVNKRAVEALVKAGAFDSLQRNRAALLASIERGFDYAAALQANAGQGGLFDDGSSIGASAEEPPLADAMPWSIRESLAQEKAAIGFHLTAHLFDECEAEVRRFVTQRIGELRDAREPQLIAGIVDDLRMANTQRGRLALFRLDDKSGHIEASVDETMLQARPELFRDDQLLIVMARAQLDRFSGQLRLNIQQVWDLPTARCRFGKYLRVAVNGRAPDIARLLREFPPRREQTEQGDLERGLPVRLALTRAQAQAEVQLGDGARFFPSDAALASWMAQADGGQAQIVYG